MIERISPPDLEKLSAYLDGELSDKDRQQVESRLAKSAELSAALEDLRQVRAIIRAAPKLRAPRNFTLTPAMAGVRRAPRPISNVYFSLRLSSVLAALFFVLVFAGDLVSRAMQPAPRVVQAGETQPMAAPFGMGGGGGGGGAAPPAPAPAIQEDTGQGVALEKSFGSEVESTEPSATLTAEPTMEALAIEAPAEAALQIEATPVAEAMRGQPTAMPALEAAPLVAENGVVEEGTSPSPQPAETRLVRTTSVWSWSVLRMVQIILAVIAIGAGLGALYLRSQMRH